MIVSKAVLKSKMLELFRNVEKTGEEIIVTDNGRPVLKVVPLYQKKTWNEIFPEGLGRVICTEEKLIQADEDLWKDYTR